MTEENKENCNFQQNYNVFGLDDKPCCYLYHKYCNEIDSCYFKRCKRLEQENKELKEDVLKWQKEFSRQYQINENKGYSKAEENYRSALEEIRNDLKEVCKEECDYTKPNFCGDCDCRYGQILNKINEVLK